MKMLLHSKILGEGPTLLIFHGLFGSADNWITLAKKFATHFQVHLIDLRNHGRSFHAPEMNYTVMVNDIKNYIDHYQLTNVFALGHSMGGKVVMQWAMEPHNPLTKILIADIAPKVYPAHHQHILKALTAIDFKTANTRALVEKNLQQYIQDPSIIQFLLKNVYWKTETTLDFRMNVAVLHHEYNALMQSDFEGCYAKPTLFLKGENSHYIESADLPKIRQYFPQAQIKTIPNAGHWLHAENPVDFFETCMCFLKEN